MSKTNRSSQPWHLLSVVVISLIAIPFIGCDRGASDEVRAARQFADAVVRNDAPHRDSMIATHKFKEYFQNPFVASDMRSWFNTFYDAKERSFKGGATADVDHNLQPELDGALIDTNEIAESGMVKVKSPNAGEESAYFWMVRPEGKQWKVAMVTKGETQVNFR